jgi:uracil-DNA glycosylase
VTAVLRLLAGRGSPVVFIGFGDQAAGALRQAGLGGSAPGLATILRDHPARGDSVLAEENPFTLANDRLAALGAAPVSW